MRRAFKFYEFKQSTRGVAAIEFAILLPFLLVVLFGVYQVTSYVTAVRKIDNVTNDIGYILSREGCIRSPNAGGNCITSGGKNEIETVFSSVIPFLIYPYKYADAGGAAPTTSQIQVKFVGLPVFSGCDARVNNNTVRLMWEEVYPPSGATSVQVTPDTPAAQNTSVCSGSNCPTACDGNPYLSTYGDASGNRANIIFPGQSFIIVNFAYDFQALLGENFIGLALPHKLEKLSSYPSRSSLGNVTINGAVTQVILNNMHLCTNCNVLNSTYKGTEGGEGMREDFTSIVRQICDPTLAVNGTYSDSGGCQFY